MLKENLAVAEDSEDLGDLQALETLDSLESKLNQVQVAYQQFYTTIGAEGVWKSALDGIRNYIDTLNSLPKLFGTIPTGAIAMIGNLVGLIKNLLINLLADIADMWQDVMQNTINNSAQTAGDGGRRVGRNFWQQLVAEINNGKPQVQRAMQDTLDTSTVQYNPSSQLKQTIDSVINNAGFGQIGSSVQMWQTQAGIFANITQQMNAAGANFTSNQMQQIEALRGSILSGEATLSSAMQQVIGYINQAGTTAEQNASKFQNFIAALGNKNSAAYRGLNAVGQSLTLIGSLLKKDTDASRQFSGALTAAGGAVQALSTLPRLIAGDLTALPQMVFGIMNLINGFSIWDETDTEKLERLTEVAEDLNNKSKQAKADTKSLAEGIEKYKELEAARYDSAEAAEEFQNAANELGEQFPILVESMDSMGNVTLNAAKMDDLLADSRQKSADATLKANEAELEALEQQQIVQKNRIKELTESLTNNNTDSNLMYRLEQLQAQMYQSNSSTRGRDDLASTLALSGAVGVTAANFTPKDIAKLASIPQGNFVKNYLDKDSNFDFENFVKDYDLGNIDFSPIADSIREYYNELNNQLNVDSIQSIIDSLNALKEIDPVEDQENFVNKLREIGDEIYALPSELQDQVSSFIGGDSDYAALFEAISELDSYEMQENALSQTIISNWLNSSQAFGDAYEVLNESSELLNLMSHQILQDVVADGGKWKNYRDTSQQEMEDTVETYNNFYQQLLDQGLYEDFIKDYSDQDSFSAADLENKYGQVEGYNLIKQAIQNSRATALENARNNIINGIQAFTDKLNDENIKVGASKDNISDINNALEKISTYSQASSYITEDMVQFSTMLREAIDKNLQAGLGDKAVSIAQSGSNFFMLLGGFNADIRNTILESVQENGISTIEGIQAIIDTITNNENISDSKKQALLSNLTAMRDNVVENYALSVQSQIGSFGDDTKKAVQSLAKAKSGVGATELGDLINQARSLGVNIGVEDFEINGSKAVLSSSKFSSLVSNFIGGLSGSLEKYTELADEYSKYFDGTSDQKQLEKDLRALGANKLKDLGARAGFTASLNLDEQGILNWNNIDWDGVYNSLANYIKDTNDLAVLVQMMQAELQQEVDLKEGKYASLLDQAALTFDQLKELANSKDFKAGSVEASAKEAINKGFSSLISDVLTKGVENINLEDYDGLTDERLIKQDLTRVLKGHLSYQDFVNKWGQLAGQTLEEANKTAIQALEKDQAATVVAPDALKEIKYLNDNLAYASTNTLNILADAFKVNVETLFDPNNYNVELGGYKVNLEALNNLIPQTLDYTIKNILTAAKKQSELQLDASNILADVIKSRDNITEENIASLANILGIAYETAEQDLTTAAIDGSKKLNVKALRNKIISGRLQVSDAVLYQIEQAIDDTFSSITNILGSRSKGFTNTADMTAALNDVNKYLGEGNELDFNQMYQFDDTLGAFTLTRQGLIAQIGTLYAQLPNLTDAEQQVQETLIDESIEGVAKNINVADFASAERNGIGSEAYKTFYDSIQDYLDVLNAVGGSLKLNGIKQYNAAAIVRQIQQGGQQAVDVAEQLAEAAGQELSASDVEAIYRSQVSKLTNAYDQLTYGPGAIIDSTAQSLFEAAGIATQELGETGQYVVLGAGNLTDAYRAYLKALKDTGEAALSDINAAAAKVLANRDGEQDVIDALGDAAGMTYERFGEILAKNGIELTETLIDDLETAGIAQGVGGNKMRIIDFQAFADLMNWDADSEEYVSAFKTFNDSLVDMNRKAERNILEEVQSIGDADFNDKINLTQLYSTLNEETREALNQQLLDFGAILQDGILTIADDANIPAIIQTIATQAQEDGSLLQQDMAQLADALDSVLKSFGETISNGIEGKLSNEDAFNLQRTVDNLGMDVDIQFVKTADGIKIAKQSAVELYQELKEIDGLAASIAFDSLVESLTKSGDGLSNISETMGKIANTQRQIQNNEQAINHLRELGANQTTIDNIETENKELREQLSLYQQIAAEQMQDPESFDFMGRDLPDYLKGAQNYWNSVGEAYKAMNESAKSGYMAIEDFYNIANEMQNLAVMSGSTIDFLGQQLGEGTEGLANILEKGFSSLSNIDGEGVKINLSKLASNLEIGAADMSSGFDDAVKEMARGQIKMLDGLIAMLEVIVQMEELGDLDVEGNGLDLSDIFETDTTYTEGYTDWANHIDELLEDNEDLKKKFQQIVIDGYSLYDIIQDAKDGYKDIDIENQQLVNILQALYEAGISDDYDLENLIPSILDTLSGTGATFTYTNDEGYQLIIDNSGQMYEIDWQGETQQEKIQKAIDIWNANHPDNPIGTSESTEWAQGLVNKWAGTTDKEASLSLEEQGLSLILTGEIITVKDEKTGEEKFKSGVTGQEYNSLEECTAAMELEKLGATNVNQVQVEGTDSIIVEGSMSVGKTSWTVRRYEGGTVEYTTSDGQFTTTNPDAFAQHQGEILWKENGAEEGQLEYYIGQVKAEIKADVQPKIELSGGAGASGGLSAEQKTNLTELLGKTKEEIEAELSADPETVEVKYGIKYTPGTEGTDTIGALQEFAESNGVETRYLNLVVSVSTPNGQNNLLSGILNGGNINGAEAAAAAVTIPSLTVNVTDMAIGTVATAHYDAELALTTAIATATGSVTDLAVSSIASAVYDKTLTMKQIAKATASVKDLKITSVTSAHYDSTLALTEDIANGTANVTNMTVGATNIAANGGLAALQGMNFSTTSQGLLTLQTRTSKIDSASFSNFEILSSELSTATDQAATLWDYVSKFANQSFTVTLTETHTDGGGSGGGGGGSSGGGSGGGSSSGGTVDTSSLTTAVSTAQSLLSTLASSIGSLPDNSTNVTNTANAMKKLPDKSSAVGKTADAMSKLKSKSVSFTAGMTGTITGSITATISATATGGASTSTSLSSSGSTSMSKSAKAKGNVALAKGSNLNIPGEALARGKKNTLMGELGPELVVTNGRYYVAGENGPEMVDLPSDAIVFNHKQTEDLLHKKHTRTRGETVTNENNAISWATGNVSGPAMASASAALAALKELRAMWQALLDASAKDLGSKAGLGKGGGGGSPGGGGGGGGGGGDTDNTDAYIHDLEIWYNLLRQIEHIEMHISEEEKHQSAIESARVANGYEMYDSMQRQLDLLDQQISKQEELKDLQEKYYSQRAGELQESAFGNIFSFDEDGLMQYADNLDDWIAERTKSSGSTWKFKDGKLHLTGKSFSYNAEGEATGERTSYKEVVIDAPKSGLDFLAMLNATDSKTGKPVYTADQQVDILKAYGLYDEVKYDASGKEIKLSEKGGAVAIMQNFWDRFDGYVDEMDSLYDGIHESTEKMYELDAERNEILQKLADNEISIENDLLEAIEAREQAEIDRLTDEKEALQEATEKFINGLNDQLDRERQMYENQQSDTELVKLQRQLAILQRSGGSASQIRSLQDQIAQKSQDQYFQKQQDQIDAVQAASDKQVQQMEEQIELMEETLEYQKENGLLWAEVRDIMNGTPESIIEAYKAWNPEYLSISENQRYEAILDLTKRVQEYIASRDNEAMNNSLDEIEQEYNNKLQEAGISGGMSDEVRQKAQDAYKKTLDETGDVNQAKQAAKAVYDQGYQETVSSGGSGGDNEDDEGSEEDEEVENEKKQNTVTLKKGKKLRVYDSPFSKYQKKALAALNIDVPVQKKKGGSRVLKASGAAASYVLDEYYDYIYRSGKKNRFVRYYHLAPDPESDFAGGWFKFDGSSQNVTVNTPFLKRLKAKVFNRPVNYVEGFDTGGYTGQWGSSGRMAMLHEKELVLNKDDTSNLLQAVETLRELYNTNALALSTNTLSQTWSSILSEMYDEYQTFKNEALNTASEGSIIINEANVNVNVPAVANDYDSRRIGTVALDEMVKIARKTGVKLNRR